MKLSTRDKNLIVFVICAAIIVLAYVFGYQHFSDKNTELESENKRLDDRIADLKAQLEKEDFYKENIATKTLEYNKLLAQYPEGINQENQYQFMMQLQLALGIEDESGMFSMTRAQELYDFPQIRSAGEEYSGLVSELNITFKTTYDKYKAFLKYLETSENEPTVLLLENQSLYTMEWPVYKSFITSINTEMVEQVSNETESVTKYLNCSTTFKQLAIASEDRIYLNPTIVDIPGYQPELSKENIFELEKEGAETADNAIERAKTSYDFKVDVEEARSTIYASGGKSELTAVGKTDKDLYITVEEGGSAGLYFVTYSFGADAYTAENKTGIEYKRVAVMPQDKFDILVTSAARFTEEAYKLKENGEKGEKIAITTAQDKLTIHLNNTTQKEIYLTVLGMPAKDLEGYTDKYEAYSNDGLQYVVVKPENITQKTENSVIITSQIDEEVKALSLLKEEEQTQP